MLQWDLSRLFVFNISLSQKSLTRDIFFFFFFGIGYDGVDVCVYDGGSGYDGVGVCVYDGGSGYDGVGVCVYDGGSGYDGGVCVYDGGSGYDGVGDCGPFFLYFNFHTLTKVQFILSNAVIWHTTRNSIKILKTSYIVSIQVLALSKSCLLSGSTL